MNLKQPQRHNLLVFLAEWRVREQPGVVDWQHEAHQPHGELRQGQPQAHVLHHSRTHRALLPLILSHIKSDRRVIAVSVIVQSA